MQEGWASVTEAVFAVFKGAHPGVDGAGATIAEDTFGTTDSLVFEGDVIVDAAVDETLMTAIEAAGEALLAVL